jgi:long-chain fatty acid transport protein
MKRFLLASSALAALSSAAVAGGVERSILPLGVLFEEGNYAQLSFGGARADVSGDETVGPHPVFTLDGAESGDMTAGFGTVGLAFKGQVTDELALALFYDQPYGADVAYPNGTNYYAEGARAKLDVDTVTAMLKYRFPTNISVYGGLRYQTMAATASLPYIQSPFDYDVEGERDGATGYIAGVAYEIPEIALRVSLTYSSEIDHKLDTTETSQLIELLGIPGGTVESLTDITTPQSVTLDFQTGIAADTLLFGSVRWVDWTEFEISPEFYTGSPVGLGQDPLVEFEDDRWTYTLGLGRSLNETWSVAGIVSYEPSTDSLAGNLGPTDGFTSLGGAVTYTRGNVDITAGLSHIWLGDAETPQGSDFEDNTAIAAGVQIGFSF